MIQPFRYRGYVYDVETGWYYLKSRYYDPEVGRFLSADALLSTGQGILGYNMYAYCLNDPVRLVDYDGLKPGDTFATIDEAAKDAALFMGPKSFEKGWEYGATIYEKKVRGVTHYTYTKAGTAESRDSMADKMPKAPWRRKSVATVHTHPYVRVTTVLKFPITEQTVTRSEFFSPGDKERGEEDGVLVYIYDGKNGELRKYDPNVRSFTLTPKGFVEETNGEAVSSGLPKCPLIEIRQ
jgi:RHS repeat-associated protein